MLILHKKITAGLIALSKYPIKLLDTILVPSNFEIPTLII